MNQVKKTFLFIVYIWLRIDPILRLAFGRNWTPRYEFMASIFGEKDAENFLKDRVKIVKAREQERVPCILPSDVEKQVDLFLQTNLETKSGQEKRIKNLKKLFFWALDSKINQHNIDSYKTRSAIIDAILGPVFQNCLNDEAEIILASLQKIVFSRITYLGAKGEPSPAVHNTIIAGVNKILTLHFNEIVRIRDEKLEELTRIKLIKEIKSENKTTGSLAFSGSNRKQDRYSNKFPLSAINTKMLIDILKHYQYSAWPESRDNAQNIIQKIEKKLGYSLEESLGNSAK